MSGPRERVFAGSTDYGVVEYVREDLFAAAQAEIARLTAERDEWKNAYGSCAQDTMHLTHRAEKAEAERDAAMAGRVKVKPLVWDAGDRDQRRAYSILGEHIVTFFGGRWFFQGEAKNGMLDAQAAAQADYEARILAAIQPDTERAEPVARPDLYLICKHGAYYRPNASGYTRNVNEAGRYTLDEAIKHTHPNGSNGPRDGMTYIPAPPPQPAPAPQAREITVQEAAEVPEVKALIEAAWCAGRDAAATAAFGARPLSISQLEAIGALTPPDALRALADMQKGG